VNNLRKVEMPVIGHDSKLVPSLRNCIPNIHLNVFHLSHSRSSKWVSSKRYTSS